MTLYEMLDNTLYYGDVMIWSRNSYDQCMCIYDGDVIGASGDTDDVWGYLMNEVDQWIAGNEKVLIYVKDTLYDKPLEEQYSNSNKWTREKRPFRYSIEVEDILRSWRKR